MLFRPFIRFGRYVIKSCITEKFTANKISFYRSSFVVLRSDGLTTSAVRLGPNIKAVEMKELNIVKQVDNIIKSENDKRSYKGLELSNGLRVLLISDPATDKSSASLDVNIGSLSDPRELPGLAHFLEHMLFLGTEKFPEENSYSKYIKQHGGASNAFTSATHTNFYFDISPGHLDGALDIFAQFFICPLFTESATEREVNAVNSEHERNRDDDTWRISQLEKSTSDPNHDYSKFGTGNIETLQTIPSSKGIDVRTALLDFHSKWYSANIMGLTVLGKEPLEKLIEMVVPKFIDVKDKNAVVPVWKEHPYRDEELRKEINVVPIKDARSLSVRFPIPDYHNYYKSQPEHYVAHLVGHEGPGSLLSELKARGWVNVLSAYGSRAADGFGFFNLNVDLTVEGIEKTDEIVTMLFQYLAMIKKSGPQEWIFEEFRKLEAIRFRFKDKESPMSYVRGLASMIHDYPMHEVIAGSFLLRDYRPDLITDLWDRLIPANAKILVVGKKFEGKTDLKEEWYMTDYTMKNISEETLHYWRNCGFNGEKLYLPAQNEFITENFEITKREDKALFPQMLKNTDSVRLWYQQDNEYLLPKAFYGFEISTPVVNASPLTATASALFTHLLSDALNEYVYNAELANLGYNCFNTSYGVKLEVGGFNEKLNVLISKIVDKLTNFKVDEKRFNILKEAHFRSLRNYETHSLNELIRYYTILLTSNQCWTYEDRIAIEDDFTYKAMKNFVDEVFHKINIEALICGNVSKEEALQVTDSLEQSFKCRYRSKPLPASHIIRHREHELPDKSFYVYNVVNPIHQTRGIQVYFQTGPQSSSANVTLELMSQLLSEPCFHVLRTQEQLGYATFSALRRAFGVQGFRVIIQSEHSPAYLDERIEAFLVHAEKLIEDMPEQEFEAHKKGLVNRRLEKPKQILSYAKKQFEEIGSKQYHFDRDNVEVKVMEKLTKQDVLDFFKMHIAASAPCRKKLSIRIFSRDDDPTKKPSDGDKRNGVVPPPKVQEPTEITNVQLFKDGMGLYPLGLPYIDVSAPGSKL